MKTIFKLTAIYLLCCYAFLIGRGYDEKQVFIGDVSTSPKFVCYIQFMMPHDLIEVGDTLFFILKNDTVFSAQTKSGEIYMRRHSFHKPYKKLKK